mgnify:CR=1 FL=1
MRRRLKALVQRHHDFIFAHDAEVLAHQFIGEVGVNMLRIEQFDLPRKCRLGFNALRDLRRDNGTLRAIFAPSEYAGRPRNGKISEVDHHADACRRQRRTAQ